jgi:hypothetical protein
MAGAPNPALPLKAAMILDRRISLPRFHSHCFSSFTLSSVPVGFLSRESVLPSLNRPRAKIRVASAWARPDSAVTEVRYRSLTSCKPSSCSSKNSLAQAAVDFMATPRSGS